jgi:hypothetical protein
MKVELAHPANTDVLQFFASFDGDLISEHSFSVRPPIKNTDLNSPVAYWVTCHPDIVKQLWDVCTRLLPKDCRWTVDAQPILVHPENGIIFAFAWGSCGYAFRLPPAIRDMALTARLQLICKEAASMEDPNLEEMDDEWVSGNWHSHEPQWCLEAYHYASKLGNDHRCLSGSFVQAAEKTKMTCSQELANIALDVARRYKYRGTYGSFAKARQALARRCPGFSIVCYAYVLNQTMEKI